MLNNVIMVDVNNMLLSELDLSRAPGPEDPLSVSRDLPPAALFDMLSPDTGGAGALYAEVNKNFIINLIAYSFLSSILSSLNYNYHNRNHVIIVMQTRSICCSPLSVRYKHLQHEV